MSFSRTLAGSVALGCMFATAACASGNLASPGDPFNAQSQSFNQEPVLFTIENNDFKDATIYGYWNGVRERLGMVIGKTSETFSTDWKSESFRFYVDFVGGGEYTSESVPVYEGDHLNFVILGGIY